MGELSEVPVQATSPACYTIEDDDEPEVVYISDNDNILDEDSRDGEPSSTTSDIHGDEAQADSIVDNEECIDAGGQPETSESDSTSDDEGEGSGNVLNDCIKLIDLVKSYEKVDGTVKTKFKDGFLFLENLQTQFEDTERNITEKDRMIAELITEHNKLKEDHKQLKGEMSTQSLQFGMLKNKYAKLEEEVKNLKTNEKKVEEPPSPVIPMPTNLSLEMMKSKADKLQQLFRQLCSKMSEERVAKSDPESMRKSKELKSFQNEVGVLFIKVQHKLSKWAKNQVKMEEELEHCKMSLEQLHDMVSQSAKLIPATEETSTNQVSSVSQMETLSPTVAVLESSRSQPGNKKRKLPLPSLVPLHIPVPNNSKCNNDTDTPVTTVLQKNKSSSSSVAVPNELPMISSHSRASESGTYSDGTSVTKSTDIKTMPVPLPAVSVQSPPQVMPIQPSTASAAPKLSARPPTLTIKSTPAPTVPMQSSPHLVSTLLSPALSENRTNESSRISPPLTSPSLYQLPPLPPLNFPLPPIKPVVSTSTPTSSSEQVVSPVYTVSSSSVKSKAPKVQPSETKPKAKRRRAKTLKTSPHLPQTTSAESRYPFTPPQYSQVNSPVHPQYNSHLVSHFTPNIPHQATLQACQNQFLPQQQQQISSTSAPPVSTQTTTSPLTSIPETFKQTNVTPQNKCLVCKMTFSTIIQLKLHHTVVHSNKKPSSAFNGPVATSPPTSTISYLPNQQNLAKPSLAPPPPLQERYQNAASLQRVPSMGQTAVTTKMSNLTTTTAWSTNEPNQKRHCSGLSPHSSVVPPSFIPNSAQFPVNNSMTGSVNYTQSNGNNSRFSWFDLF